VDVRTLPGILQSGLWPQLTCLPQVPTRGLVADVGNDILYGFSAEQTLAWVEEAVDRLQRTTHDIVMTDLPLASIRRLSRAKFLSFRSILVPRCRLSLANVVDTAERVNHGLATLAARRSLRLFHLKPEWYGFDPIHFRLSVWRSAWQQILCGGAADPEPGPVSWWEAIRLYRLPPERQWLFGWERVAPQSGVALKGGARVWLF